MKNKDLNSDMKISLKVITNRVEFIKANLPNLMKRVEWYAIDRQKRDDFHDCIISADEWTYAALDCKDPRWRERIKRKNVLGIKIENPEIPIDFINELPCTIGEILTLGSWSLTKNIFRFEDEVIKMLLKTEYNKSLPSFLLNLPDIAIYIQTDNADLKVNGDTVVGVVFSKNTLNSKNVLFTTIYTDSGLVKTISMFVPDQDDYESTIDDCLADFLDTFFEENNRPSESSIRTYTDLQKKLINLILWFSQKEPDLKPLTNNPIQNKVKLSVIKRELRLFEAAKYKPTIVGIETNKLIKEVISEREATQQRVGSSSTKIPHPRKPHWNYYWVGKRGTREKFVTHWIPFKIVGGVPKKTDN